MTVEEVAESHHQFQPDPVSDQDLVTCPHCCQASPLVKWERGDLINCDLCGEHVAIRCPICDETFDEICDEQTFHVIVIGGDLLL